MTAQKTNSCQLPVALAAAEPKVTPRNRQTSTEIDVIGWWLEQTGWNRTRKADLLSNSHRGPWYKTRQRNITPELLLSRKPGWSKIALTGALEFGAGSPCDISETVRCAAIRLRVSV